MANGAAEYVERTICHNELFFPQPSLFNDPFDCRPSFVFEGSDEEIITYYARILKKHRPHWTDEQRLRESRAKVADSERSPRNPAAVKRVQDLHTEQITEKIGVLCLSTVKDDILMWSHYADSHRGICLEFDGYFDFFSHAQEVKYPTVRPRINPFRQNNEDMMEAALLTKADHWKYEQEWRIVHYTGGPGIYRFPEEALTGVILGAHISPKDERKVREWVDGRHHQVNVYRSTPCDTTFSLGIVRAGA
ncbi:DUF2971 domain-containing protein [Quatrionicoccus australiensis]|uniref:DUF2971 domain-containing protein n=1 Tax=Quatrionicoccus australiensis TaxID=138118 RepID=UPI001CF86FAB|nr:DUF2971 domain-containing protein [Quatrionicoccus australiensis]UCV13611.1 DUF2971 domain-containing protein [Quatrionicoccus australiensis]